MCAERSSMPGPEGRSPVALVYSEDAMARTDAAGEFQFGPKHTRPTGMIWIEAEGYALCEYPTLERPAKSGEIRIALASEELIAGRALVPTTGRSRMRSSAYWSSTFSSRCRARRVHRRTRITDFQLR